MARLKSGERERRIQIVVDEVIRRGVEAARVLLTKRWDLSRSAWCEYLKEALARIKANSDQHLAAGRELAIGRLDKIIADPKTTQSVRIRAIREQILIGGYRAPVRQLVSVDAPPEIPSAVADLLSDQQRIARELAADESHLAAPATGNGVPTHEPENPQSAIDGTQ